MATYLAALSFYPGLFINIVLHRATTPRVAWQAEYDDLISQSRQDFKGEMLWQTCFEALNHEPVGSLYRQLEVRVLNWFTSIR